MQELKGNIWDYNKDNYVLITTNGSINSKGACVMGRGVALQAKERFPKLPFELGDKINRLGNFPYIFPKYKIITCPVKYKYFQKADIKLICYSLEYIERAIKDPFQYWCTNFISDVDIPIIPIKIIYMPRPGCDNGKLDWEKDVKPKIKNLLDERFTVVSL